MGHGHLNGETRGDREKIGKLWSFYWESVGQYVKMLTFFGRYGKNNGDFDRKIWAHGKILELSGFDYQKVEIYSKYLKIRKHLANVDANKLPK